MFYSIGYRRLSIAAIKYLSGPKLVQTSYSMSRKHLKNVGEGGFRTHGTLARSPVFKTGAFDHSAVLTDFV